MADKPGRQQAEGGAHRRSHARSLCAVFLLAALTAACGALDERALDAGIEEAAESGLQRDEIDADPFRLVLWHRGLAGAREVTVYLEGDGRAWLTRRRLSDDPTPRDPVGLRLAARDPGGAVLYLSRPCQYGNAPLDAACEPRFWSSRRYGPEVLGALNAGLEWARDRSGDAAAMRFGLVGYSGGGALAALLAARRDDIAWLVTVAANLDTQAWSRHHELSPLTDSLDPLATAPLLRGLPQLHLAGSEDDVVPAETRERFLRAAGSGQRIVDGASHACCWVRDWPQPLCEFLATLPIADGEPVGHAAPPGCQ